MESYIEITWFNGFLVLMNSTTLAFYLACKPCAFYKMLAYSVLVPLFACFCFGRYEWLAMCLLEGLFFYLIYRDSWKGWLLMIAHRLLCNLTCYVLYEGTFHLGIYFVPSDKIPWLLWGVLILTWCMMFFHYKYELSQQSFLYPLEIRTSDVVIKMKGYLDSGNLLMEEGKPVLFLDQTYEEYFQKEHIEWIVMNTVQGIGKVPCFEVKARIGTQTYHNVLVHINRHLQLPMNAKALLNIHMMTQE